MGLVTKFLLLFKMHQGRSHSEPPLGPKTGATLCAAYHRHCGFVAQRLATKV